MPTIRQNFAEYLRALQILFFSLLAGQILVFTVMWFFVVPPATPGFQQDTMVYAVGFMWLAAVPMSFILGKSRMEAARDQRTLSDKLAHYRAAVILRLALLEGPVLACFVIFFFATPSYILLGLALAALALFATNMPGRNRLVSDLDLSMSEQNQLDDPNLVAFEFASRGGSSE